MTFTFYAIPMAEKIGFRFLFVFFACMGSILAFIPILVLMFKGREIRESSASRGMLMFLTWIRGMRMLWRRLARRNGGRSDELVSFGLVIDRLRNGSLGFCGYPWIPDHGLGLKLDPWVPKIK